ncbi:MAG: hypothetical protein KAY32_08790 [Candidatus Eisenbacteria sp.]|nr:hypothetical protein [Candidatus Eisenbacteria bacterium]
MSRKAGSSRAGRWALGPLLIAFFSGALLVVLVVVLLEWPARRPGGATAAAGRPAVQEQLAGLAALLDSQAEWEQIGDVSCPEWHGRIVDETSLVRWNAGATAALGAAGFEILAGKEDLIHRRNRWPLQRLTLEVGVAGEQIATVIVETGRSPSLPPPF